MKIPNEFPETKQAEMDDAEIRRRFNLWNDQISKTNTALNDIKKRVDKIEKSIMAFVDIFIELRG